VALRMTRLSKLQAEGFYAVHRERPFFASLVKFMTEGPIIVMALEREDAIAKLREMMARRIRRTPRKGPFASASRNRSSATASTGRMGRTRRRWSWHTSSARWICPDIKSCGPGKLGGHVDRLPAPAVSGLDTD